MTDSQMHKVMLTRPVTLAISAMLNEHVSNIQRSDQIENATKHELSDTIHNIQILLHTLTH